MHGPNFTIDISIKLINDSKLKKRLAKHSVKNEKIDDKLTDDKPGVAVVNKGSSDQFMFIINSKTKNVKVGSGPRTKDVSLEAQLGGCSVSNGDTTEIKDLTEEEVEPLMKNIYDEAKTNITLEKQLVNCDKAFPDQDFFDIDFPTAGKPKSNDGFSNPPRVNQWDNDEGYYRVHLGEIVDKRYKIYEYTGHGMFSNVVRAHDQWMEDSEVAIKIIRNNPITSKTGLHELEMLKQINAADAEKKFHCVRLYDNFYHKSHLCMVLEPLTMNLRQVLRKYGRYCGLNIKVVRCYAQQMLLALKLLKKLGILHADIKPDNVLVDDSKTLVKLCDFGSSMRLADITPFDLSSYLMSRFYRAPEIILGVPYDQCIDTWATACTIYELSTGKVMFAGQSNNEMLKYFMDLKGKISNSMLLRSVFRDDHFDRNCNFIYRDVDIVTEKENIVVLANIRKKRNLQAELMPLDNILSLEEIKKLTQFKDLLEMMLVLDPKQRATVNHCIAHPFIQEKM